MEWNPQRKHRESKKKKEKKKKTLRTNRWNGLLWNQWLRFTPDLTAHIEDIKINYWWTVFSINPSALSNYVPGTLELVRFTDVQLWFLSVFISGFLALRILFINKKTSQEFLQRKLIQNNENTLRQLLLQINKHGIRIVTYIQNIPLNNILTEAIYEFFV